jgi:Tfp pilus assembly protein PilV
MRNVFKRLKSQQGMSGVLVALLLVVVGVGLIAGVNTYLTQRTADVQTSADASLATAGVTVTNN